MKMSDLSLKAAREAAAKVNAMLVATGQLRPSDLNKGKSKTGKSSDLFVEEVIINDAPMSARNFLTRSYTQEEISKMSGASVSTRGRFMTQDEIDKNTSNDRSLYLHIQGVNQQDVKVAVGRIMHLIMEHTHRKSSSHHQKNKVSKSDNNIRGNHQSDRLSPFSAEVATREAESQFQQNMIREKVFLPSIAGLNPVEVRCRLFGENNSNLKYIQDETGASVLIRGIGSGFIESPTGTEFQEALHFYLEHSNQEKFNEAKDLIVNLAQTIMAQIHQEQQEPHLHQNLRQQIPLNNTGLTTQVAVPSTISAPNPGMIVHAGQQMPPPIIMSQQPPAAPFPQVMAPQSVSTGPVATLPGQPIQEISPGTQLIQIAVSSAGPNLVSQQIVQTSAGPQLVQLPHGTHIVSTPEGPRLVPLTPSSVSTAFVAPTTAEQQMQVGVAIPPQPVPPVVSRDLQGENYNYETEKSPSVVLQGDPQTSTTFAYLQQHAPEHETIPPPTSTVALTHTHWAPPSNSIVLAPSQVEVVQASLINEAHQSTAAQSVEQRPASDWNVRIQPPIASYGQVQDPNIDYISGSSKEAEITDPNSYMWAQYPQAGENPSRTVTKLHMEPPPQFNRIDGGNPLGDRVNSKLYLTDGSSRQPPRKALAQAGFESKRRRSFKPKGEFKGGYRQSRRELDDTWQGAPNEPYGAMQPSTSEGSTPLGTNLTPQDVGPPFNSEALGGPPPPPNSQWDSNGGPPPPWNCQWDSAGGYNNSLLGLPRSQKPFQSPWESGIPGLPVKFPLGRDVRPMLSRNIRKF